MTTAKKAFSEGSREQSGDAGEGRGSKEAEPNDGTVAKASGESEVQKGDEEWEQVGPKNKSTITRQVGSRVCVRLFLLVGVRVCLLLNCWCVLLLLCENACLWRQ